MPDAPLPPATITRLLASSFPNQVRNLLRSLRSHPLRALDWVEYWRARPEEFNHYVQALSAEERATLPRLYDLYRVVTAVDPFGTLATSPARTPSVQELFINLKELTLVVGQKYANSLMVRGSGGTGKTWTVQETLKEAQIPFVVLRGYSTALAFYSLLYQHRTELIVVDDTDSIFGDVTGLNILKAVLDSCPVRTVSWNSMGSLPPVSSFNFEGQVIFVSNMSLAKVSTHMQAVLTRILVLHMDLTPEQILQQISVIRKKPYKQTTEDERYRVYAFLKQQAPQISDLNLRHYTRCLDLLSSGRNWRRLFISTL